MSLIRRPVAPCIITLFQRDHDFFFDRPKPRSPAETTQERQRAAIVAVPAECGLSLLLQELEQRRQLITRRSFRSDAADGFSDRAIQCRQYLFRFTGLSGIRRLRLGCQTTT